MLAEIDVELTPIPTEVSTQILLEITRTVGQCVSLIIVHDRISIANIISFSNFQAMCNEFNELRSEMVLLYELKNALAACEQELHSLKGQFEAVCPGKVKRFLNVNLNWLCKVSSLSTLTLIPIFYCLSSPWKSPISLNHQTQLNFWPKVKNQQRTFPM